MIDIRADLVEMKGPADIVVDHHREDREVVLREILVLEHHLEDKEADLREIRVVENRMENMSLLRNTETDPQVARQVLKGTMIDIDVNIIASN